MRSERNQAIRRLVHARKHDDVLLFEYEKNRIHWILFRDDRIKRKGRVDRSRPIHGGHVGEPKTYGEGGIPKLAEPVRDNGRLEAFRDDRLLNLTSTHSNPPHSLIKRAWERVKGVLHRGH
jgi:hypothetical protein